MRSPGKDAGTVLLGMGNIDDIKKSNAINGTSITKTTIFRHGLDGFFKKNESVPGRVQLDTGPRLMFDTFLPELQNGQHGQDSYEFQKRGVGANRKNHTEGDETMVQGKSHKAAAIFARKSSGGSFDLPK